MYHKLLRQLRSPTKGDVPDTHGDDYVLGKAESESMSAEFPGLITANLSGAGRARNQRRKGVNNGRAFGQGGRKASVAKVWIQAALTKGTGTEKLTEWLQSFIRELRADIAFALFCSACSLFPLLSVLSFV